MEYVRLGSTGLKVSRICLGCMSYGQPGKGMSWVLDEESSRPYIKRALEAGAIGYLLKDVSADELARAIRAAYSGHATLSPEAAQALVQTANQPLSPALDLTERELEVLVLMVEGLNNTQIAGKLTVSPSTVKSHVSNILSKFRVASRTEAVTLALRNHIVS